MKRMYQNSKFCNATKKNEFRTALGFTKSELIDAGTGIGFFAALIYVIWFIII